MGLGLGLDLGFDSYLGSRLGLMAYGLGLRVKDLVFRVQKPLALSEIPILPLLDSTQCS